jgi:hypothetical protein
MFTVPMRARKLFSFGGSPYADHVCGIKRHNGRVGSGFGDPVFRRNNARRNASTVQRATLDIGNENMDLGSFAHIRQGQTDEQC